MLGPPVISETEIAQYGAIGDTVQVHCETRSAPDIAAFIWRFNGEELDKQSPALSIVESRTGNKVKSTLVIKNAQEEHFGEYYCAVENELGQAEAVIRLQQLGKIFSKTFKIVFTYQPPCHYEVACQTIIEMNSTNKC